MKVAVIMSTYNGEKYLRMQIESILHQQGVDMDLYIRDDGSSDDTPAVLKEYIGRENVHVFLGKNIGYAASFLKMLYQADACDYYAFSDQDDYWEPEKLYQALNKIRRQEETAKPVLYYSNLIVSDVDLNPAYTTALHKRKKTLQSTFIRRSIAGNTMVFNSALRQEIFTGKLTQACLRHGHDSFIVSLCYALDGCVICDENAYIRYRQHINNTAGAPLTIKNRLRKELDAIKKEKGYEAAVAGAILNGWKEWISPKNREILKLISDTDKSAPAKIKVLLSGDYDTGDIRLTIAGKLKIMLG